MGNSSSLPRMQRDGAAPLGQAPLGRIEGGLNTCSVTPLLMPTATRPTGLIGHSRVRKKIRHSDGLSISSWIAFTLSRAARLSLRPYEPAALKRLMGDLKPGGGNRLPSALQMLCRSIRRGGNGLRASVESYSIKKLEPLCGFSRATPLSEANKALTKVQACLELGDIEFINEDDRDVVVGYIRDDGVSTWRCEIGWKHGVPH